eukprot:NODE_16826_length_975_cov_3.278302.p5 GENE.NODE_16826_length_975_cov_3.278302~~NODE_16826_length_975_cov_3.278302.p5  ORF type:complete len:82 (+),score=17.23 NODE_16826_length_975_cov_3.278302:462-707(+)
MHVLVLLHRATGTHAATTASPARPPALPLAPTLPSSPLPQRCGESCIRSQAWPIGSDLTRFDGESLPMAARLQEPRSAPSL